MSTQRAQTSSVELDNFQNLMGTFFSKVMSLVKFLQRSDHLFQRYEPSCGKMSYLAMLSCQIQIQTQITGYFQTFMASSLSRVATRPGFPGMSRICAMLSRVRARPAPGRQLSRISRCSQNDNNNKVVIGVIVLIS